MRRLLSLLLILLALNASASSQQKTNPDSQQLGKALDYFIGGKYHEALMLLTSLDKKYELNPRFKAYIGVCYYYEWEYELACQYLDKVMEKLEVYAPQERNIYYKSAAESHFMLQEYDKAIPFYERQLLVCFENEKADAFFRLGFCYMFEEKWECAIDYFKSAIVYYENFHTPDGQARKAQLEKMIKGCDDKMKSSQEEEKTEP